MVCILGFYIVVFVYVFFINNLLVIKKYIVYLKYIFMLLEKGIGNFKIYK